MATTYDPDKALMRAVAAHRRALIAYRRAQARVPTPPPSPRLRPASPKTSMASRRSVEHQAFAKQAAYRQARRELQRTDRARRRAAAKVSSLRSQLAA